jgi:hypothetical protein
VARVFPRTASDHGRAGAKGVALLTGDDLINLEAAWAVLEAEPAMSVIAHIDDIRMKREMDRLMGDSEG